jgi:hypothetical protein
MPLRKAMTDEELKDLFRKSNEALAFFGEKPDALGQFVSALKEGKFSEARISLEASLDRRRKERLPQRAPQGSESIAAASDD